MNDLVVNKVQSIRRCVIRAREEYAANPERFADDFTRQDAAILNVLRACEQAIDLANHLVRRGHYGVPTSTAESFDLLCAQEVITADLADKLRRMVHFRNIAVHQYRRLDLEIVRTVIFSGLEDLLLFGDLALDSIAGGSG